MRFCYQGFYGKNHSWSVIAQNISRSLLQLGNSVDVFSTNGTVNIPSDLLPNVVGYVKNEKEIVGSVLEDNYDASFSYTALKNSPQYLRHSKKNRFLIWCYEFSSKNSLPPGFAKNHISADLILPPSHFAKQVFLDSGVPENKMVVLPHGVNVLEIQEAEPIKLKTKKSIKILINLGQIHRRKNLDGAFEMYGRAFSESDDVCLVLKVQDSKVKFSFELSFNEIYGKFLKKFPNHAEVEIIKEFIPNIYSLYKSCDITFSPSHCEGFGLVPIEGLAVGLIPIASRYGGFLDFLDDQNSLLIDGENFMVPPNFLYYQSRTGTTAFKPFIDSGVDKLKFAVENISSLKKEAIINSTKIIKKYNWLDITKTLLSLTT
jgi:glycosyltransferase involved in cell wall biosynthesis